jgi:hypothetical protein
MRNFHYNRLNTDFYLAIAAYTAALRLAFISAALFFLIALVLLIPIKLPNLLREEVAANSDANQSSPEEHPHQNGHTN